MGKILYNNIALNNLQDSEIAITGEITLEALDAYRVHALKNLGEHLTLPGFRRGHIPEPVLRNALGDVAILEEIASLALSDAYPKILTEQAIDALGRPRITLTKPAPGNPVGFSIQTAVVPPVSLPDYVSVAQKITAQPEDLVVEEKEIEEALRHIQESVARPPGTHHNSAESEKKSTEETSAPLPELTDDLVQQLGDFKDVADFREKLVARMKEEKKLRAREKKRIEIADKLAATEITLPKILIDSELSKMLGRLKEDLQQANGLFNDYLSHLKKTEEDIRNDWNTEAKKRATLQLVMNAIAQKENITAPGEEIERRSAHILKQHKDADPENVRVYVETMLGNEAVFRFLENQ